MRCQQKKSRRRQNLRLFFVCGIKLLQLLESFQKEKYMNKKDSEPAGKFTRVSQMHTPENKFGEAIRKLNDSPESPEIKEASSVERRLVVSSLKSEAALDEPKSGSVRASEKLLLNITDCRLLTGLSEYFLRDTIKAGTLKAKIIGRGYKIKKLDLEEFVKNL